MDPVIFGLAAVAAFGPASAWAWFFFHRDRYEREPRRLIVSLFLLGAFAAIPLTLLVVIPLSLLIPLFGLTFMAGVTEEPIKTWVMSWRTRRNPELDEPVDGLIYGTTVGLGFAALETTFYILGTAYPDAIGPIDPLVAAFGINAPLRAITSAPMHAFCSGIAGYYFARLVLSRTFAWRRMILPLAGVALLHGVYNLVAEAFIVGLVIVLPAIAWVYWRTLRRALAESPRRQDQLDVHVRDRA